MQLDFLGASRLVDPSTYPGDIFWPHPMIVLQDGPSPDVCGELVLGQADAFALEIFGAPDAIFAHVKRCVSEGA
ncbi:hypothetical protein D3C87_1849060 [compost metagenome]